MLGKLVNKFKRQTIHDGINLSPPKHISSSPAICDNEQHRRRSARLNPDLATDEKTSPKQQSQQHSSTTKKLLLFPVERVSFVDGCGSSDDDDDDELEQLEKNSVSNASIGIGSVSSQQNLCGQSPPVLTSSPPLISEIDTNSWDSAGCESGIVLRESAERDDSSRNLEFLDESTNDCDDDDVEDEDEDGGDASTPVEKRDSFPLDFSALHHELSKKKKQEDRGGAFQPVFGNSGGSKGCSPTPIGEKRRWGSRGISGETSPIPPSPIASRTRGATAAATSILPPGATSGAEEDNFPRAVLTARRTRVKVIFHDPNPRPTGGLQIPKKVSPEIIHNVLSESPPNNLSLKRGRHSKGNERPSLNFDKMREQMMQCDQPDAENMPFSRSSPPTASSPLLFLTD